MQVYADIYLGKVCKLVAAKYSALSENTITPMMLLIVSDALKSPTTKRQVRILMRTLEPFYVYYFDKRQH